MGVVSYSPTDTVRSAQRAEADSAAYQNWCFSPRKYLLDRVIAAAALICLAPLMIALTVLITITSQGPVIFRQKRVKQDRKEFWIFKFRTMRVNPPESGPTLTAAGDSRVTPIGRILRRTKLDELPQLLNVLRGELSLVGPRPELPKYVDTVDRRYQAVWRLRPGITSYASLRFRHEEVLLASLPAEMREEVYISRILPEKIETEMEYARSASFATDLGVMLHTVIAICR
jgi:lipopolysaccharide/colanic/teichoic acid biosynthesis glycosyltransferase